MKALVREWITEITPSKKDVGVECRPGAGSDTCIWLVGGAEGFECVCLNRPHALLDRWRNGDTVAKRDGCDRVNSFSAIGKEGEVEIP